MGASLLKTLRKWARPANGADKEGMKRPSCEKRDCGLGDSEQRDISELMKSAMMIVP